MISQRVLDNCANLDTTYMQRCTFPLDYICPKRLQKQASSLSLYSCILTQPSPYKSKLMPTILQLGPSYPRPMISTFFVQWPTTLGSSLSKNQLFSIPHGTCYYCRDFRDFRITAILFDWGTTSCPSDNKSQ